MQDGSRERDLMERIRNQEAEVARYERQAREATSPTHADSYAALARCLAVYARQSREELIALRRSRAER